MSVRDGGYAHSFRQEGSAHTLGSGPQERRNQSTIVAREFKGDGTLYDAFAPSSTPSTGRVKSHHIITADVILAYFHVDEEEECFVDPPAEWLEQRAAPRNPTSVLCRLREQLYGRRRAGTRWEDFMAERFEEQISTAVTRHHNSLQIMSWMLSLRHTWMISMALDRDLRWTSTSDRKSVSKSGLCTK